MTISVLTNMTIISYCIYIKVTSNMKMKKGSANTHSFLIIFLIPILAFSLTSAGILNSNTVIGIDAYAKKSDESSAESSRRGSTSSSSDKIDGAGLSSSGSDSKSSLHNSNNEGNNKNNDQGANDGSNTGTDNNLKPVEPPKTGKVEQGARRIVPPDKTVTSLPPPTTTSCEQASTCTTPHQQDLSNHDHLTTPTAKDNKTPFILSIPFP
jgi:cytoskeletal protein RodZ